MHIFADPITPTSMYYVWELSQAQTATCEIMYIATHPLQCRWKFSNTWNCVQNMMLVSSTTVKYVSGMTGDIVLLSILRTLRQSGNHCARLPDRPDWKVQSGTNLACA